MKKKVLLAIDSNSVLHRAFHALPPLTTKKGELVNAVYGFLLVLLKAIKDFDPYYIVACFDHPSPTFRHKKYKHYKAKRPPAPKEFYEQIPKLKKVLEGFNIPVFEKEGFEADDILATIAKLAPRKQIFPEIETIILSGDLDSLQLIDRHTKVYFLKKGVKEGGLYDEKEVEKRYNLSPSQLLDLRALRGDPSDNIPGVTGIGEKTAIKLLKEFESLENLYKELEENSKKAKSLPQRIKELLIKQKDQAFLSKHLAKVKKDVPIEFDIKKCEWRNFDQQKLIKILKSLEFKSLIKKVKELFSSQNQKPSSYNLSFSF